MNLTSGGEQAFLRDGYYTGGDGTRYIQSMWKSGRGERGDSELPSLADEDIGRREREGEGKIQKGLQQVLVEREL